MKLYEISNTYMNFLAAVEAGEVPEEAKVDTLDAINGEFNEKADSIACLIKNELAEADAIEQEAKNLLDRVKSKKKNVEWLKGYLLREMQAIGKSKVETPRNMIKIGVNPPSVKIKNDTEFVLWATQHNDSLLTYADPKPNKTAIKELLKAGEELPGVELVRGDRITIK